MLSNLRFSNLHMGTKSKNTPDVIPNVRQRRTENEIISFQQTLITRTHNIKCIRLKDYTAKWRTSTVTEKG